AEIHQQEGDVLVVEELPIAGAVALGADVVQSRDRLQGGSDQPLPLKRGRRGVRSIRASRSSVCHLDSSQGLSEEGANLVPNTIAKAWRGMAEEKDSKSIAEEQRQIQMRISRQVPGFG